MLSPGETVLTPSQLKGLGGSVNNTSITVNMGAGETVQTDVQGTKTQGKMLAMAITGAVTKEIAKQKKPGGTLWVGGPRGY
jgi:NAD(P)H-flavin reductase